MKRDLDLVRKILLACEASPHGYVEDPLKVDGYPEDAIGFHVHLMMQAGLLIGIDVTRLDSESPYGVARSVTWAGYEFLEASRDDHRWDTVKKAAASVGGFTLDVMKATLGELAAAAVKSKLGLP
jgi:hypothetical protein